MLTLIVPEAEFFNEMTEEFETHEQFELIIEHSLLSLSKWESKYKKPFLSGGTKSPDEVVDYVECMILSGDFPRGELRHRLSKGNIDEIQAYVQSSESATTFGTMPETKGKGEVITAELIYYWMVAFQIPFECEKWHLNRLFALIRICNIKNSPPKKMSKAEIARKYQDLNRQRREKLGTTG